MDIPTTDGRSAWQTVVNIMPPLAIGGGSITLHYRRNTVVVITVSQSNKAKVSLET